MTDFSDRWIEGWSWAGGGVGDCLVAPVAPPAAHRAPRARCRSGPALRHSNVPPVRRHCRRAGREILQSTLARTADVRFRRPGGSTLAARPAVGRVCRASRDPVGPRHRRVAEPWAAPAAAPDSMLPPNQRCPRSRGSDRRLAAGDRWPSRRRCRSRSDRRPEPPPVMWSLRDPH